MELLKLFYERPLSEVVYGCVLCPRLKGFFSPHYIKTEGVLGNFVSNTSTH